MEKAPLSTGACCLPQASGLTYLRIGPEQRPMGMMNLEVVFRQLLLLEHAPEAVCNAELAGIDALVLNKADLLPYIDFDIDYLRRGVEALNPGMAYFTLSCKTGDSSRTGTPGSRPKWRAWENWRSALEERLFTKIITNR